MTSSSEVSPWRGKWALVTGASAGIGKAFAELLASGGVNLVLTARRSARLDELAARLESTHGIRTECIGADLERPAAPDEIFAATGEKGIDVDLLINNAGYGVYGEFKDAELGRQLGMVQLNCAAVVHLTHLYLSGMVARRSGGILIVASTAAYQPVPYLAAYAATKAFDLLFAEALAREVKRYGVRVCALSPGPTSSEFQQVSGYPLDDSPKGVETAEKVARTGLAALAAGKHSVISGFKNELSVQAQRIAPRRLVTGAAEKMLRPPHLRKV